MPVQTLANFAQIWRFWPIWDIDLQNSTLLVKILSDNSEIQNLPKTPLRIYKKIFFSGSNSKIFINKVDFGPVAYLAKLLQFGPAQKNFLPIFLL